jgi:hypothetical protein
MKRTALLPAALVLAVACSEQPVEPTTSTVATAPAGVADKPSTSASVDVSDQVKDLVDRVLPSFEEKSAEALQAHLEALSRAALAGDHGSAQLALLAARSDLKADAASPVDLGAVEATLDVIERELTAAK